MGEDYKTTRERESGGWMPAKQSADNHASFVLSTSKGCVPMTALHSLTLMRVF